MEYRQQNNSVEKSYCLMSLPVERIPFSDSILNVY